MILKSQCLSLNSGFLNTYEQFLSLVVDSKVQGRRHHGLDHAGADPFVKSPHAFTLDRRNEAVHNTGAGEVATVSAMVVVESLNLESLLDNVQWVDGRPGWEPSQGTHA